ncbi:hypothetical protein A3K86_02135 [Photobacterium jeanii]|uniref:DUF3592 domain-containing protein n=1 Tax=Photobacterium jeanii TaxID=858640 RepID=A0A178KKG9_9GAMM|nr:DUF3592 domain-containing protein [Photobacterium jeanii]OAN17741.1 hypothetical protein A3K86_02135 [Photobacterium jeanii]PST92597.1 DUF3592 domain-containing protein [Photobacterium jeanii]
MKLILRIILALLSALLIYISYLQFGEVSHRLDNSLKTNGTVIDYQINKSEDNEGRDNFAPIVTFTTQGGSEVQFVSSISSNPPKYKIGQTLEVLYEAEYPDRAVINSFFEKWSSVVILLMIAAVLLLFSWMVGRSKASVSISVGLSS